MVFQAEDRAKVKRQQADLAIQLALRGRWLEAVQLNRSIIESFPTDVDAFNRLGKALTELGKYADARDAYMKALETDPLNSIARKNLSRLATLGEAEPKLGQRLIKLMDAGNEYVAAISALGDSEVRVFIRETFQHASQTGKLSFPPTVTEQFRPYTKGRLVRHDADDDTYFEEAEEGEDWEPGGEREDGNSMMD